MRIESERRKAEIRLLKYKWNEMDEKPSIARGRVKERDK